VSAHVIDGDLYALAGAAWKANFKGLEVRPRSSTTGKTTAMRGELIQDRTLLPDLYLRCAQAYGVKRAQRMMGVNFRDNRIPDREEFAEAIERLKTRCYPVHSGESSGFHHQH